MTLMLKSLYNTIKILFYLSPSLFVMFTNQFTFIFTVYYLQCIYSVFMAIVT